MVSCQFLILLIAITKNNLLTQNILIFFRLTYVEDILVSPGPCNIPIIDGQSFTNQQFLKEFAYKHPFVLRDASNNNVIFLKLMFSLFKI